MQTNNAFDGNGNANVNVSINIKHIDFNSKLGFIVAIVAFTLSSSSFTSLVCLLSPFDRFACSNVYVYLIALRDLFSFSSSFKAKINNRINYDWTDEWHVIEWCDSLRTRRWKHK